MDEPVLWRMQKEIPYTAHCTSTSLWFLLFLALAVGMQALQEFYPTGGFSAAPAFLLGTGPGRF
jgi:hypothetical protein